MKKANDHSTKLSRFWKVLGPGLVTGASDDDPSGIATYSQAGAAFGLLTLWTALVTFPLMASIQAYLFFWQATMEVEDKRLKTSLVVDKKMIKEMRRDVDFGMLFSNLVMFFIILTTGTVLFGGGIQQIDTVEQAAQALKPLVGNMAYLLFALGVIGTGLLAIPVLSGALSYIIAETFSWNEGLNKKFHQAKPFYAVISVSLFLGLLLNYIGLSPIKALIYSAILYGLTAPVMIAIILHISNNKKIMGNNTNSRISNILGFMALALMTAAAFTLIYFQMTG